MYVDYVEIYKKYLSPLCVDSWNTIESFEQPSLYKQVETRTTNSTKEVINNV